MRYHIYFGFYCLFYEYFYYFTTSGLKVTITYLIFSKMASSRGGLPKPVLNSPAQQLESSDSSANTTQMEHLITKLSFPDELEKNQKQIVKEEHKKRIQNLRKELDYVSATNWRFNNTNSAGTKF